VPSILRLSARWGAARVHAGWKCTFQVIIMHVEVVQVLVQVLAFAQRYGQRSCAQPMLRHRPRRRVCCKHAGAAVTLQPQRQPRAGSL